MNKKILSILIIWFGIFISLFIPTFVTGGMETPNGGVTCILYSFGGLACIMVGGIFPFRLWTGGSIEWGEEKSVFLGYIFGTLLTSFSAYILITGVYNYFDIYVN